MALQHAAEEQAKRKFEEKVRVEKAREAATLLATQKQATMVQLQQQLEKGNAELVATRNNAQVNVAEFNRMRRFIDSSTFFQSGFKYFS